jgi:hypothetical protein
LSAPNDASGQSPYQTPVPQQPKGSGIKILVIVLGLFVVLGGGFGLFCCGGGLWIANLGLNVLEADLEAQLRDHPTVLEHLGEIESFEMDWVKSGSIDDGDTFVYHVVGSKDEAELTITSVSMDDGSEEIVYAEMRLSGGETHVLVSP